MAIEIGRGWDRFHPRQIEAGGEDFAPGRIEHDDEIDAELLEGRTCKFGGDFLGVAAAQHVVREIAVGVLIGGVLDGFTFIRYGAGGAVEVLPREILFDHGEAAKDHQARHGEEAGDEANERGQDDDDCLAPERHPPVRFFRQNGTRLHSSIGAGTGAGGGRA